jgi:hypothetical protein
MQDVRQRRNYRAIGGWVIILPQPFLCNLSILSNKSLVPTVLKTVSIQQQKGLLSQVSWDRLEFFFFLKGKGYRSIGETPTAQFYYIKKEP